MYVECTLCTKFRYEFKGILICTICCDKGFAFQQKKRMIKCNDTKVKYHLSMHTLYNVNTREVFFIVGAIRDKRDIYSHFEQFKT